MELAYFYSPFGGVGSFLVAGGAVAFLAGAVKVSMLQFETN